MEPEAGHGGEAVSGAGGRQPGCCANARIVMPPPGSDHDLCLGESAEDLSIGPFVVRRPIEALVIAIFPW